MEDKNSDRWESVEPGAADVIPDIFLTLTKTIKTFNTYPSDNPVYKKFANELLEKFNAFFEFQDDLQLSVESNALVFIDKVVFQSDDKIDNIALLLFTDGIKEISFLKGLTMEEIIDFIEVLRQAPKEESLEDDIVTLLWEKDIEHFTYFVPEELSDDAMELDFSAVGVLGEGFSPLSTAAGATYSDLTVKPVELGITVEPINSDEIEAIRDEAALLDNEALMLSSLRLFFGLMAHEKDLKSFAAYADSVRTLMEVKLRENDIPTMLQILKKLNSFANTSASPEQKEILRKAIDAFSTKENLLKVLNSSTDFTVISGYIHMLGSGAAPSIIEILADIDERKMRRFLCDVLVDFAKSDMTPFEKPLMDKRWFLVRNLIMILGMTKDTRAIKLIEKIIRHPEIRIRREAVKALSMFASPEAKRPLMSFLNDSDPTARVNAIRALRKFADKELLGILHQLIMREDFKERSFTEKREILFVFGEVGKAEAFPVLAELFKKKGFFKRDENLELRAAAAYGLGKVATPEAVALLENEVNSKKSILREACQRALKGAARK